ncbi:MFS transporter [Paenibacillus psychroresistens]|uniref:MFS transporter n=1 Tax=Paenibacillus psychroresistens TaxID=1778678 RepID=A0A6B8RSY5_9BACL|nr:MFS transporter [Paenibacillus psychroresistens]QGQ99029.1 MFS transporter [Paenibacillus psychroresistens]
MKERKKWDLAALASIPLIMTLANSMLIPVLPLMQKELHISSLQASLIITVYAAVSIVFIPVAGYLSDRWGRKKIIIIGLSIATIGGCISGFVAWFGNDHVYLIILLGRFIQGIGAAGAFPIVLPLVGDMLESEEEVSKGLGMIETSNTFGKVISPILGSVLALIVWYFPLAVIPFICLISIAAVLILVKVPKKDNKEQSNSSVKEFITSIKKLLLEKGLWVYTVFAIGCISMFILFGFLYYLSTILEDTYRIYGVWKGTLLAIPLSAICLASFLTGKFVGKSRPRMKWCTFVGAVLLLASMLLIALLSTKSLFILITLLFISSAGIGIMLPCLDAFITEGIEKKQRGTISSLYSSMRFIGVALGPLITALFLNKSMLLFYSFALLALICGILTLVGIKPAPENSAN